MKIRKINIELIIIIAITACILFLMYFADSKLNEIQLSSEEELLIIHDDFRDLSHEEFAESIAQFRPGTYKMIEVYTENFEQLFRVQFLEDDENIDKDIREEKDLIGILSSHEDGHTNIVDEDMEEDIYFRWITDSDGQRRLVIIYMSHHIVDNLWVFHIICYILLALVAILTIRLLMVNQNSNIQHYKMISNDIRNRLID